MLFSGALAGTRLHPSHFCALIPQFGEGAELCTRGPCAPQIEEEEDESIAGEKREIQRTITALTLVRRKRSRPRAEGLLRSTAATRDKYA